jgi:hypothetical protein
MVANDNVIYVNGNHVGKIIGETESDKLEPEATIIQ